jgi:hypothetical protein
MITLRSFGEPTDCFLVEAVALCYSRVCREGEDPIDRRGEMSDRSAVENTQ